VHEIIIWVILITLLSSRFAGINSLSVTVGRLEKKIAELETQIGKQAFEVEKLKTVKQETKKKKVKKQVKHETKKGKAYDYKIRRRNNIRSNRR